MPEQQIAIIGAGNLGVGLAVLLSRKGHVVTLGSRDPEKTKAEISTLIKTTDSNFDISMLPDAVTGSDLSMLCVPDHAIAEVCGDLSTSFKHDSVVCHCSGALDSSELATASSRGLSTCSAHPLNSFPSKIAACEIFEEEQHATPLFCEGDASALRVTQEIFENAGFKVSEIQREAKPLYHAASVIACNYLTVLMDCSLQAGEAAGLEEKALWPALQPLIQTTLLNISTQGTRDALSGPIARGDVATVKSHVNALSDAPDHLLGAYKELGRQAVRLAARNNKLDKNTISRLLAVLR